MIHTAERAYKRISEHQLDNPQQTDEMIVEFFGRAGTTKRKKPHNNTRTYFQLLCIIMEAAAQNLSIGKVGEYQKHITKSPKKNLKKMNEIQVMGW